MDLPATIGIGDMTRGITSLYNELFPLIRDSFQRLNHIDNLSA